MSKVDYLNPLTWSSAQAELKKAKEKPKATATRSFSQILEQTEEEAAAAAEIPLTGPSEKILTELLDSIHQAGEELKNMPTPETIRRYRGAVKQFLHYVVENSYTVREYKVRKKVLELRTYTMVAVIDSKLEQLAAGILSGQIDQIRILAKLDEINGLLIDLTR